MNKILQFLGIKHFSNISIIVLIGLLGIFGAGAIIVGYSGEAPKIVVEGDYIEAEQPVIGPVIGAFPGTDFYEPINFHAGFANEVYVTSTEATAITLLESELDQFGVFEITSQVYTALSVTMPATSTLSSLLPNPGDARTWKFRNHSTSTSATVLTLTAGTGWDLTGVDTNADTIAAAGWGIMDCYRESASSTFAAMGASADGGNIMCEIRELVAVD